MDSLGAEAAELGEIASILGQNRAAPYAISEHRTFLS